MAFPNPSWFVPLTSAVVDGPTLTAAAAASCIPTPNRITLPNGFFIIGKKLKIKAFGKITCAATTPGTAQFDVRTGPSGTINAFSTGAFNLNTVGKTNVPFDLEIDLVCRAVGSGTATQFMGIAKFQSEAVVGAPAAAAGGNPPLLLPITAPVLGTGFDNTAANVLDLFYTPSLATTSLTLNGYDVLELA